MKTENLQLTTESPTADQILCAALDVGEAILRNGGEVHRVEDTIERICKAYGAEHVEVFTITSLIVASIRMPDETRSSQMRRVYRTVNNLYMLEQMNEISRALCTGKMELSQLRESIQKAKHKKPYPVWLVYLGVALGAGSFAAFFGGSWRDAVCAGIVGIFIFYLDSTAPSYLNQMVMTAINSFLGGIVGIWLVQLGLGQNMDKVIIGSIMILIPGLALSNAMRDMLGGDVLSGTMRLIHSVLLALMIALGFALALTVMGGVA